MSINTKSYEFIRNKLLQKEEIAFLDVREEDPHAQEHPLFAANLPLSRIEIDAFSKLPRKDLPIVTLDDGEGFAQLAAARLISLGYRDVSVFAGGVANWKAAFETYKAENEKFIEKGIKASAARARKALQEIAGACKERRKEITAAKEAMEAKK